MAKKNVEARILGHGPIRLLAAADGYVMARRPGKLPFVLSQKAWDSLPVAAAGDDISPRVLRAGSASS